MVQAERQFVAVKFRSGDARTYTYHNDGEPVACGDEVKVPGRGGEGWRRVTVHEISWTRPSFETKPILGRAEPNEEPEPKPAPAPTPVQPDLLSGLEPKT